MVAALLQFAWGTTVLLAPPKVALLLGGAGAAIKGVKALASSRRGSSKGSLDQAEGAASHQLTLEGAAPPSPVLLRWEDLTATLKDKKHKTSKMLLKGVSGQAKPGRLLAILGPSGSGKTTLLNVLSSHVPTNKAMTLTGTLTVNGTSATESNHRQAYVQQEDVFYSMLTVKETLMLAADFRLPSTLSASDKRAHVESLMAMLGLTKVANSRVGDAKRRGLSGGEKKRLSLGCELVGGSPPLIFLDEPTSGLDAAAAEKVMATLKRLAAAGHTVVVSIHQPRTSIWDMIDDVVLLNEGQVVYAGAANQALPHFASLGHVCPPAHNPAEFLSDLISSDYGFVTSPPSSSNLSAGAGGGSSSNNNNNGEETALARQRVQRLIDAWASQPRLAPAPTPAAKQPEEAAEAEEAGVYEGAGGPSRPLVPYGQQFKLLAGRSWKQVVRDRATSVSRLMANVSSGLLFGMIYWRLGRSQSAMQDRLGLMQVVAINTAMSSLAKTLNVFPRERLIVNRERARGVYQVAPYLGGKLLAELPISAVFPLVFGIIVYPMCGLNPKPARLANFLGCVTLASFASSAFGLMVGSFAPSTEAALAIGPAMMTVFILFGGLYKVSTNVPLFLRWLPQASLIQQCFSALCINELAGARFDADSKGGGITNGDTMLRTLAMDKTSVRGACVQQLRITGIWYLAAYTILQANRPKFQPLLPPRAAKAAPVQMQPLPVVAAPAQVPPVPAAVAAAVAVDVAAPKVEVPAA